MATTARTVADAIPGATADEAPGAWHAWEVEPMAELLAGFLHEAG